MTPQPPKTLTEARRRRERAKAQEAAALDGGIEIIRGWLAAGADVHVAQAARELGVARNTLYARLPELRGREART